MSTTYTATDFYRELIPAIDETPAGNIADRIAEREGIWREPCETCHGDGEHESWCPAGACDLGHLGGACDCDGGEDA